MFPVKFKDKSLSLVVLAWTVLKLFNFLSRVELNQLQTNLKSQIWADS